MVADSPSSGALVGRISHLVCLTLNAWLVNVVLADGAVLNGDV